MTTAVATETPAANPTPESATGQAATTQTTTAPAPSATPEATATSTTGATQTVTPVAPETYTLTLPQGGVVDASDITTVTAMAKERGWTNDQAQAALNEINTSLVSQAQAFRVELDAHPEIGGTKFAVAQESAFRVLDRFLPQSSPEGTAFRTALNKSGYGNYAPLMLLLSRIGAAMKEDKPLSGPATGAATPPAQKSTAEL